MVKEAPSPHEVILAPLETNPVFQCLGGFQCLIATYYYLLFEGSSMIM